MMSVIVKLSVTPKPFMQSAIVQNVVMLIVNMLNVVMLSVVAPQQQQQQLQFCETMEK